VTRRLTSLYGVLAVTDAVLAATGRAGARRFTKPLLMPALLQDRDRRTQTALALGGVGDVALLGSGDTAFTVGLGSFLASHLAWIAALGDRRTGMVRERPALAAPYLLAWGGLNAYLWNRTGKDRLPVLLYSTALLAMALAALDTADAKKVAGGALFLASDSLLALERFGQLHLPGHEGLVMATYTAAQALLAAD